MVGKAAFMADVSKEVLRKGPCKSGLVSNVSVFL